MLLLVSSAKIAGYYGITICTTEWQPSLVSISTTVYLQYYDVVVIIVNIFITSNVRYIQHSIIIVTMVLHHCMHVNTACGMVLWDGETM